MIKREKRPWIWFVGAWHRANVQDTSTVDWEEAESSRETTGTKGKRKTSPAHH
jgi:hypothetical protein